MAYQSITIKDLVTERIGRTTFLPAIQREYVWSTAQVEKLFDSIMCEYPISSFLFWKIREENKKDWPSYKFISDFDQEHPHNQEANLDGLNNDIYLVLDGQQRITSLYIGLCGTYRYFYRKWRKARLYLDLLWDKGADSPEEMTYHFLFKEDASPINADCPQLWYRVGDILNYNDAEDAKEAMENKLKGFDEEQRRKAQRMIGKLHGAINSSYIINFYEEKSDDYNKVLEIFIRTNTGGQKLEYSDILLSTATAKWRNLNAREEINKFTDEINKIGGNIYNFGKDFVMKAAMYLTEDLPIQYRISSFTKKNLECIEDHWEETKESIERSVRLIQGFGFTAKNLVATLVLLPVAQYLHYKPAKYMTSSDAEDVRDQLNIQNWIIVMLLKGVFGGASDSTLNRIRPIIKESGGKAFPYKEICNRLNVDPTFNDLEIENFLNIPYSTRYSFLILSLLYPSRDWRDKYNEDHIFPKAEFTKKKLADRGYGEEKINAYLGKFNTILNLELLEERENKSKSAMDFNVWIKGRDSNFKQCHHIPDMEDYSMDNFISFIEERKKLLVNRMQQFRLE